MTPETARQLAERLIDGAFASFKKPATITKTLGFDYETQEANTETQTIEVIQSYPSTGKVYMEYAQIQGQQIKSGDCMMIGRAEHLTINPQPDNTVMEFKGEAWEVVGISIPYDAYFVIHVRRK